MLIIPQWEHDEHGDYREWCITMHNRSYPVREQRDGTMALNVAGYTAVMSEQADGCFLDLHSTDTSCALSLIDVVEITNEPYEEWADLPPWEQAVRVAMSAWSQCLYTILHGHIPVAAA
jgi:hypothetical protein